MIKCNTLGMLDVAKLNPVLKVNSEVKNYQFVTDNGIVYLVCNTLTGDDADKEDLKFKANTFLNGYAVKAWEGQELIADEKHIAYAAASGDTPAETYASITAGTTLLTINNDGKLAIAASAPASGLYFKATAKCRLTEKAVKLLVIVVDA